MRMNVQLVTTVMSHRQTVSTEKGHMSVDVNMDTHGSPEIKPPVKISMSVLPERRNVDLTALVLTNQAVSLVTVIKVRVLI